MAANYSIASSLSEPPSPKESIGKGVYTILFFGEGRQKTFDTFVGMKTPFSNEQGQRNICISMK